MRTRLMTAALIAIAATLSACRKEMPVQEPLPAENGAEDSPSKGWTVAIAATIGSDASTRALAEDPDTRNIVASFETTDEIRVFNKTKNFVDPSPLHPDQNGTGALLTGTLTRDYEEGDELVLCYNSDQNAMFSYKGQKGTLATVRDYAQAELTVSAEDAAGKTITGTAAFVNAQSIFGFNFTDGTSAVPARAVEISTAEAKLVSVLRTYQATPYVSPVNYGKLTVVADNPVSGTFYASIRNDNEGDDTYRFYVNDGDGHLYSGEKTAPAGKIVNGKFYSSTVALTPVALPAVTLTDPGTPVGPNAAWDPTLVMYGWSDVMFGYANYDDLTISGDSNGTWFLWMTADYSGGDRTVTLDGASFTNPATSYPLDNQEGTFTIVLNGDNSITTDGRPAIGFSGNVIYFEGNGTLSITSSEDKYGCQKGLHGRGYSPSDPLQPVASPGYVLTISDGVDNGDGTTTWVYTVRPDLPALTFGLTAGYPVIPGAVKSGWEAGDAVFVFFEGVTAPAYLKMSYDGTAWSCTEMEGDTAVSGSLGLSNGSTGTMRAVYLPFGSDATVSASGNSFVFDPPQDGFYLTATLPYAVADNTLSGHFEMALPEGYVLFSLPDTAAGDGTEAELREPRFTPQGIASIGTDCTITHTRIAHGAPMKGHAYDGGYLFSGILETGARNTPAGYHFTLVKGGFAGSYFHKAVPAVTFCSGETEGRSFLLPSETDWTAYTDFIPVDLGCDSHLGGQEYRRVYWANRNLGATADTGEGSYGDFFAWGEPEPYYVAGYARETPGMHWKAGKENGYAWASYTVFNPSGDGSTFTKYTGDDYSTLQPGDDTATQLLDDPWRMPTNTDWKCLYYTLTEDYDDGVVSMEVSDRISWTFSSEGVAGYYVTSSAAGCEGNSIFLPLSGRRRDKNMYVYKPGKETGNYWTSSLYFQSGIWDLSSIVYQPEYAFGASIDRPSDTGQAPLIMGNNARYVGRTIRPVMY